MKLFFGPLIRRWLSRLGLVRVPTAPPPPPQTPKPKPAPLPPGPRVLELGGGWGIERQPVTMPLGWVPGMWQDNNGRMLVSPNRRYGWVWPARLTVLVSIAPCAN